MNILFPYMARWKSVNWTRYHNLFNEFAKKGHKIFIIQPPLLKSKETNFIEIDSELHENIHLITLNKIPLWNINTPLSKLFKKGVYNYCLSKKIENYIKAFNIDTIFIYNIPQYLIAKKVKGKVKIIFDLCDDLPEMLKYEIKIFKNFFKILGTFYLKNLINSSDLIVTSSKKLKEKYYNNAYLIPNGVDINLQNHFKKEKNNKTIIGFIGSFEYFIDFDLIMYLAKNLKDSLFFLIGSGRLFEKVKYLINRNNLYNIKLYGTVPHKNIVLYLNKFDIALIPFKKNEFTAAACPLKLFEYALFKIPIVARDLEELKKLDQNFINFYNTKDESLKLVRDIINKKAYYTNKTEIGYKLIRDIYNWQKLADDYQKIIYDLNK